MARSTVRMDGQELRKLKEKIMQVADPVKTNQFFESCAKELAARLLAKVVKRTPVGDYDTYKTDANGNRVRIKTSAKKGGTLRRGWTSMTHEEAESGKGRGKDVTKWANSLNVTKSGTDFVIDVINPVKYSSYVEFGHRTRSHTDWVEGQFMLTISEKEIQNSAPQILEKKLEKWLKECFTS